MPLTLREVPRRLPSAARLLATAGRSRPGTREGLLKRARVLQARVRCGAPARAWCSWLSGRCRRWRALLLLSRCAYATGFQIGENQLLVLLIKFCVHHPARTA